MKKKFSRGYYQKNTGYIRRRISKRNMHGLQTSGSVEDEIWVLLEYYSEIEESGIKLLETNGISDKRKHKRVFKEFQAYIRQAKGYYYSARNLPTRSSALLYYYCFLNLAKALIVTKNPSALDNKKIPHGLTYSYHPEVDLSKHTILTKSRGVFPHFYKIINETSLEDNNLNIQTLLSYCSDISYQCQLASIHEQKTLTGKFVSVVHGGQKKAWGILAIHNGAILNKYTSSFQEVFDKYEIIEIPQQNYREFFNIDAQQQNSYLFLQEKEKHEFLMEKYVPEHEIRSKVIQTFNNHLQVNYFDNDFDYIVSLPYKVRKQIPMNEVTAIYIITYYFSNLVRYHPAFLEKLLSKKEAWLIDSFLKSSTTTFLRMIASRIANQEYIIGSR